VGGAGNTTINSIIGTTSGTLSKDGAGTLILTGANTFTGATSISAGILNIRHSNALGTTAGNTTVSSGTALELQGDISVGAEALTLSGTGVSNAGALRNISGANTYGGLLSLGAASRINSDAGNLTLSNAGTITGATFGLTVGGAGNTTINSIIGTTSGTLSKDGAGTLILTGANTFTGATSISAGILNIRHSNALGTTAGNTTVSSGTALELQGDISVGAEALTLSGTGVSNAGALRNISGANTYGGLLSLGAASRINSDAGTLTLSNAGTITGATFGLTVGGAGNTTINSIIGTTSGTLSKDGSGTLILTGANTYSGGTTVNAGALNVTSAGSLASGSAFTLGASATANLANADQTLGAVSNANGASNALNFSAATGTVTLASLSGAGYTRFGSNAVVTGGISSGTVIAVGTLTAEVTGGTVLAGAFTTGTISSGSNTISGSANITTLSGGVTTVDGVATIGTMSAGTANLNGATSSITTLSGGNITLGSSTALSVSGGSSSGVISGGGSLIKTGARALQLLGINNYTGGTTLSEGTLSVNGSLAGGVTVESGGTLSGNGTIAGATTISGNLKPGNSPGLLTFQNSVTLESSATTAMEIVGNGTPTRGVSYDALDVAGALSYGGALILDFSGEVYGQGTYNFDLFNFSGSPSGYFSSMTLVGIYNGTFSNTSNNSILSITQGDNTWSFNQGDGMLTFTVVPEPNVAMVVGSLALIGLLRRRRDSASKELH
jgi:autotransporter-associated beta strand protein